jgi:PAS domain S-box-containing protein/putative nucleotidyltransferase with HDIG domain
MEKSIEQSIRDAHREWMGALDVVDDPIFMHDKDFRILRCNRAYQRHAELPFEEIIGRFYYEVFPKADAPLSQCVNILQNSADKEEEEEIRIDDAIFRSRAYVTTGEQGEYLYSIHILEDITLQKQNERKLRENETFTQAVLDNLPFGIAVNSIEPEVAFTYMNDNFPKMYRTTRERLSTPDAFWESVYEDPTFRKELKKRVLEDLASGDYERMKWLDIPIVKKGEETRFISAQNIPIPDKRLMISMVWDVTERNLAEQALRDSEARYKRITAELTDYQYTVRIENGKAVETRQSPACIAVTGYEAEEFYANEELWMQMIVPEDRDMVIQRLAQVLKGNDVPPIEHRIIRKDGVLRWVSDTIILFKDTNAQLLSYEGVIKDITDRKEAEDSLRRANRALKTLSAGNIALVRAEDEDALLQTITDIIVQKGGYDLAAVCYAQNNPEKSIVPIAWSGKEEHSCSSLHFSWDDNETGQLPVARAIRTAQTQICRDIAAEEAYAPWKESSLSEGYTSHIALPLSDNKHTFGTLSIYSSQKETFDTEEVYLLEELTNDLAYGIMNLRTRAEHERHETLLRQSLEQSVQTIAATLEARDPYTAGHQRRVAELSTAIAREMGLPEEQIQGIHFAAIIHDLGKIHIPAEILSKPSRLTDIEYLLIQTHPQEGYNILKEVKFPWPIADIILQHHERLDGSGYPQGLSGDQILLESKIISVADMVEAMSSHRPYRPGIGIEPTLDEIRRSRGKEYDANVVDACLSLFLEKGFSFSNSI